MSPALAVYLKECRESLRDRRVLLNALILGPLLLTAFLGEIGATRGRHPAHHLGGGEVLGVAADFPDPLIGFAPVP